ncbi:mCG1036294 [Mus musculus]|nr:mCG1036294 [Mus musculus]
MRCWAVTPLSTMQIWKKQLSSWRHRGSFKQTRLHHELTELAYRTIASGSGWFNSG